MGNPDINNLWDAVFQLTTHAIANPFEMLDEKRKSTREKRDALRRYFKGSNMDDAIANLRELNTSCQGRSFWHGQY